MAWRVIESTFFGEDENSKPQYFTHTVLSPDGNEIQLLSIITTTDVIKIFKEQARVTLGKNTIHLNPHVSLQRRGGGKSDSNPDHIQTKLLRIKEFFGHYQVLLSPESTALLEE